MRISAGVQTCALPILTLAFAQIVWSIAYQWDAVTGGSNGIVGIWPEAWLSGDAYYYFTLIVVVAAIVVVRRMAFAPFGYPLRAVPASAPPARSEEPRGG